MTESTTLQDKARAAAAAPAPRPAPKPVAAAPAPQPAAPVEQVTPVAEAPAVESTVTHAAEPAAPVAETPKVEAAPAPKAVEVVLTDSMILDGAGSLAVHEALRVALGGTAKSAVFKIAALQSGYTAEIGALAFEDISRIQASAVDAHAARVKLLKTLHSRIQEFSCGPIKLDRKSVV